MEVALDEAVVVSLRRETRLHHHSLEDLLQLVSPLSRARYVAALKGFQHFLLAWESRIGALLPTRLCEWFAGRSRYGLLLEDIRVLEIELLISPEAEAACARAVRSIELDNLEAVFGSMYVLEGSALGGRVITVQVGETLGLGPASGAAYFNGFGFKTAARWNDFRDRLEAEVGVEPKARREACRAAAQTFDALIATFTALRS